VESPLKTFQLPHDGGDITIWVSAYEVHLSKDSVDALSDIKDFATAVVGLVGTLVGSSVGTLTPAASVPGGVSHGGVGRGGRHSAMTAEVRLRGQYFPPTGLVLPFPG